MAFFVLGSGRESLGSRLMNNIAWLNLLKGVGDEAPRPLDPCRKTREQEIRRLAETLRLQGAFAEAQRAYECLLSFNPRDDLTRYKLAHMYWLSGDSHTAIRMWQAMSVSPGFATRCLTLWRKRQYTSAQLPCEIAVQVDPRDMAAWAALGAVYHRQGDQRAGEAFAEVDLGKLLPDTGLYLEVGYFYFEHRDLADAAQAAQAAITKDQRNPSAHFLLGRIYHLRGNDEAAIPHLEEAIRLAWSSSGFMYLIYADALAQSGRTGEAIAAYTQALLVDISDIYVQRRAREALLRLAGGQ